MAHAPFIFAAYAISIAGLAIMVGASWLRMRRAERRLEDER